jgi:hypothetical protein
MSTIGRVLVVAWLVAALVVLGMDGRLPAFVAVVGPSSLVVLGLGAMVRQQLASSQYNRPSLPERYQVADDLDVPIAVVVAVAEREAAL